MRKGEFSRLVSQIERLTAREIEDLRVKLAEIGAAREALTAIERRADIEGGCRACGSDQKQRWGRTRTGFQRWRCQGCRRTWSSTTDTPAAGLHHPPKFHTLIVEMFSGQPSTCRGAAARLGVDKMTVWRWRMRILRALIGIGEESFSGIVEADEVFQRESRKGSREWVRHAADPKNHPAPPRLRWRDYRVKGAPMLRGLSRWQKPILTVVDRSGRRRAEILPNLGSASVTSAMAARVDPHAALCTDKARHFRIFTQANGLTHYAVASSSGRRVIAKTFHIQNVNALHSRYRDFMKTFRGPATKNLAGYVAWFMTQLSDIRAFGVDKTWDRLIGA